MFLATIAVLPECSAIVLPVTTISSFSDVAKRYGELHSVPSDVLFACDVVVDETAILLLCVSVIAVSVDIVTYVVRWP